MWFQESESIFGSLSQAGGNDSARISEEFDGPLRDTCLDFDDHVEYNVAHDAVFLPVGITDAQGY